MFKRESNMNERDTESQDTIGKQGAEIRRLLKRIETVEVECNMHAEATKRAYAELRQANAKIIRLERAYH